MNSLFSSSLIAAALFLFTAGNGLADTLRLLPQACEISLALSAAPLHLRDNAGVFVLTEEGYTRHREGSNNFTCIVNRDHPRVLKPTCFDMEGADTIVPKILYVGKQLVAGIAVADIKADLTQKFASGYFTSPKRPGVAYMLSRYNRPYIQESDSLGFFPPHVMFYAPNLTNADIGHDMRFHDPEQPLPMIAYGGPQGYMIMISDNGTARSRSDLVGCPDWVHAR